MSFRAPQCHWGGDDVAEEQRSGGWGGQQGCPTKKGKSQPPNA